MTILQASQGLASYLLRSFTEHSIVIGHDHRHNSLQFAQITATVFLLKGFKVYLLSAGASESGEFRDLVPTPLVPFAVDKYGTNGGVMITASHNPSKDNGYKVYWGNGCQIIPPHDRGIAEEILQNLKPIDGVYDSAAVVARGAASGKLVYCKEQVVAGYVDHLKEKLVRQKLSSLNFIYTPMHGVGLQVFKKAFELIKSDGCDLVTVEQQQFPDPDFRTVKFPNPEEKGALDLSISKADGLGIGLVIANDPDADRFSAAVKDSKTGAWRQLTGNEIGFLFADYVIKRYSDEELRKVYLVNSTVSSQMIKAMSEKLGFYYEDTLTGFKWIGNKAIDLESQGFKVPFGFEEAIGYMFEGVHDKDGISAALVFLQMAQSWENSGTNAVEVLEQGFRQFGFFKEYNSYYLVPQLSLTETIFNQIRGIAQPYPAEVGSYTVDYWRDLTVGYQSDTAGHVPNLPTDASSQMITLGLQTRSAGNEYVRLTLRGSGTEPKLKVYIEAKAETEERAQFLAKDVWDVLRAEWFKPEVNGLVEQQ